MAIRQIYFFRPLVCGSISIIWSSLSNGNCSRYSARQIFH